ncbi:MAG TPA: prepilin-type N-terminal cleavage/methylation domain-containing protein, partial [Verrucomicrobiae bacterium]|nr:prepilin-type N-terminal cleavage/methylation domain-containing protein [Verrucomicrobiae bacterium]
MISSRSRARSGFTLIEVVISAALMALILVSAYLCLNACLSSQKMIEPRSDVIQNARVAMALMTADLRNACPLSPDAQLLGVERMLGQVEADNLDFATHNYTPRRPGEGDFCETSYYVDKDPDTGQFCLYRRRNPMLALDPLSGGSREEIAQGVMGVRFEYFDGLDWYENWGN